MSKEVITNEEVVVENEEKITQPITQEEKPFRIFKTQKEFDDYSAFLKKSTESKIKVENEDGNKKSVAELREEIRAEQIKELTPALTALIKKEIEEDSKKTEMERVQAERTKNEEWIKNEKIKLNRRLANSLLTEYKFSEDEKNIYLETCVNEDEIVTMGKIQLICDNRKNFAKQEVEKVTEKLTGHHQVNTSTKVNTEFQTAYDNEKAKSKPSTFVLTQIMANAKANGITLKL